MGKCYVTTYVLCDCSENIFDVKVSFYTLHLQNMKLSIILVALALKILGKGPPVDTEFI